LTRRVLARDPLSGAVWHNLGYICHCMGLLDESEKAFIRANELGPNRQLTSAMLALVYLDKEQIEGALKTVEEEPDEFWRNWGKAIIFPAVSRQADSDLALAAMLEIHTDSDAYQIAEVYSMRGELDEAFEWLERAFAMRDPGITHAKADPRFRPLHDDSRWPAHLTKIGFD